MNTSSGNTSRPRHGFTLLASFTPSYQRHLGVRTWPNGPRNQTSAANYADYVSTLEQLTLDYQEACAAAGEPAPAERLTIEQMQHVNGMGQAVYLLEALAAVIDAGLHVSDTDEYKFRMGLIAAIAEDLEVLGLDAGDGPEDTVNIATCWLADHE